MSSFTKNHQLFSRFAIFLALFFVSSNFSFADEDVKKKYKGNIDLGATLSQGNSREQSLQANANLTYSFSETIENIFRSRAENKKLNDLRTKEEYFVNNQTRQNLGEYNFRFVELEFISDRFGGYNYRTSQTIGLGRRLINKKDTQLSVQIGSGLRQSKLTNDEKIHSATVRFGLSFSTKFNDILSFQENLDISADRIAVITRSDANLRISLNKTLYLKLGVLMNHVSDVPAGRKRTDITTALKVGYEF